MAVQTDMSPADNFYPITPNDAADLAIVPRGILVTVSGTLHVTKLDGTEVTTTVPAGMFPGRIRRLWAAGTTATGFTGFV